MFRHDFQFELEKLVRENIMKTKLSHMIRENTDNVIERHQGDAAADSLNYASLPTRAPSAIQRFMEIDCVWNTESITNILWSYETQEIDTRIAESQRSADENSPTPGASRMKELRKEKIREPVLKRLKHLLAAKALRTVEHERGLVDASGVAPINSSTTKSLPMHKWPSTPFYDQKLKSMREARLRLEKSEYDAAKKQYRKKMESAQKGKGFYGKWEFKNKEEELVARIFIKTVDDQAVTANRVAIQAMDSKTPSVFQNIELLWVPDPLIVKLAIDPARLKALLEGKETQNVKSKQRPKREPSSPPSESSKKKPKLGASQEGKATDDDVEDEDEDKRISTRQKRKEQSAINESGEPSAKPKLVLKSTPKGKAGNSGDEEEWDRQFAGMKRKATPASQAPGAPSTRKRLKLIATPCQGGQGNAKVTYKNANKGFDEGVRGDDLAPGEVAENEVVREETSMALT